VFVATPELIGRIRGAPHLLGELQLPEAQLELKSQQSPSLRLVDRYIDKGQFDMQTPESGQLLVKHSVSFMQHAPMSPFFDSVHFVLHLPLMTSEIPSIGILRQNWLTHSESALQQAPSGPIFNAVKGDIVQGL